MPGGCTSTACVTAFGNNFNNPYGVALDGNGNVYVADSSNNAVKEIERAIPPNLAFQTAAPGSTSTDSPQTVTVENIGNATLQIGGVAYAKDFPEAARVATDCTSSTTLGAGNSCTLSIDFSPLVSSAKALSTPLSESVSVTDNNLNGTGVMQSISVNGTETVIQAALTSPAPSSVLVAPTVTFTWSPAAGATSYSFRLGTTKGSNNLYASGLITKTSATPSSLPTNGQTIFARLYTYVGSSLAYIDYTFTAAGAPATLISPTPGAVLAGSSVTFSWTPENGATGYQLRLGSGMAENDLYGSGATTATFVTPTNLPTNGQIIYALLYTNYPTVQVYSSYTFTAAGAPASLISPAPGSVFGGPSVTFSWTPQSGASGYQFRLGTTKGGNNLYGSGATTATSATPTNLPLNGETIYGRLYTNYGVHQVYADYSFTAGTTITSGQPQTINFANPGSQSVGVPLTLSATASSGLAINFGTMTPTVCMVSGAAVTFLSGGNCTIIANQLGNSTYAAARQVSATFVVAKGTPVVSVWPVAGPITYGQTLAYSAMSPGKASVPGVFAWNTPATVPPAGTDSEILTFTPANTAGYNVVSTSVSIAVTPTTIPQNIKHIVVIMQENRSFDNLFMGFPGADTVTSGMNKGTVVPLQPVSLQNGYDIAHGHPDWWQDLDNGSMDGWHNLTGGGANLPFSYVPQSETVPYWTLAQRYTLADRMFQSNTGPSFIAHQYMIAGQSATADENPLPGTSAWGCDAPSSTTVTLVGPNGTDLPGVYPCFDYPTLADRLDAAGVSWRYYAPGLNQSGGLWSAYQAIRHIRFGSDWTNNVISPNTQVLTDIANGQLAQMTWIVPANSWSDHGIGGATAEGPSWVADIVNAIGASQFWDSTAIFITWDDWGGWYDHVVPPQIDTMGLGFRVPLIIVSPYARTGYVSHNTHEFSSFLKYAEETFGLSSLGARDVYADDFSDCFDYTLTPQPYTQIPVTYSPSFFISNTDSAPPDDD